ncbi:MAG TPA: hypothetical protein VKD72_01120 [Gemmataceae bacterium]|nr:hypothetical protein [Gemmataceae bacterium]
MAGSWRRCLVLAGCGGSGPERFIPAEDKARPALEAALTAWQRGEPHGPVAGSSSPVIQFADSHHKPGQRLRSFAVLSLAPGDGPRVFSVKLTLENPAEEVRARYVVVGLDPLWVIRHEDWEMIAHWDHPMKSTQP